MISNKKKKATDNNMFDLVKLNNTQSNSIAIQKGKRLNAIDYGGQPLLDFSKVLVLTLVSIFLSLGKQNCPPALLKSNFHFWYVGFI